LAGRTSPYKSREKSFGEAAIAREGSFREMTSAANEKDRIVGPWSLISNLLGITEII
jgi:hypothetical protein